MDICYTRAEVLDVLGDAVPAGFRSAIASYMESLSGLKCYGYFVADSRLMVELELDDAGDFSDTLEFRWDSERNELSVYLGIWALTYCAGNNCVKDRLTELGFIKKED